MTAWALQRALLALGRTAPGEPRFAGRIGLSQAGKCKALIAKTWGHSAQRRGMLDIRPGILLDRRPERP